MKMSNLAFLPIGTLGRLLAHRELEPIELAQAFLARIRAVGSSLNCFITICEESAVAEASESDKRMRAGHPLSPLDGIPIAVKDNMDVAGVSTSNGFGGAPYRVPEADSEVVRRLRAAGAIIVGKLNLHEGALGATNDNPHFGRATNPYRDGYSPGGSNGGSGAAVAAGLCCAALGSGSFPVFMPTRSVWNKVFSRSHTP